VKNITQERRVPVSYCFKNFIKHSEPHLDLFRLRSESVTKILFSSSSSSSCSWRVRRVSSSLILKMKLVPPSVPRSSYVPSSVGLYCSACFGSLFVSILCTCCSHFFCYCRSRGIKVAAPPLDSPCDKPVTYPGDTKIFVKPSERRSGF
jgi:hypothetical protein